eukprot:14066837-Alexandrium_andersonii.AAC.1
MREAWCKPVIRTEQGEVEIMMQGGAETTKVLGRVRRMCEEVRRIRTASVQSWSREVQNHWGKLLSVQGRFPQIG